MPRTTPAQLPRTTTTTSWSARRCMVALLSLLISPLAAANTVALVPMLPNGAQPQRVQDVFQLMSSELEFMAGIDSVAEVKTGANLTNECLDDPSCLARIAASARADSVLTGVVTDQGATIVLDIVYHDGGVPRRQAFTVPSDATALANQMTEMLQQVIAGRNSAAEAAAEPSTATFTSALDDGDDFMMPTPVAPAPRAPAPASSGYDFGSALVDAGPTPEEQAYQARQVQAQQQAQMRAQQQAQMRAQQQAQMRAQQQAQMRAQQQAQLQAQQQAQLQAQQQAQLRAQQQAQLQAQQQAQLQAQQQAQQRAQQEAQRQAQLRAQQEAQQRAQQQAQLQAQQEAQRQAQARAQQEAQLRAQQQAQLQAQQDAARRAQAAPPAPAPGGFNISFASSADKIEAQQIDAAIQFGPPPGASQPAAPTYPQPSPTPPHTQQPAAPAYGQQPAAPTYGQQPTAPAYGQQPPAPAYQQRPAPAYQQRPAPNQAYQQPAPAYQQPAPAYQAPPSPYQAPAYQRPTPTNPARDPQLAQEERDLRDMKSPGLTDLDGPKERGRAKMTGSNEVTLADGHATRVQVTGRAGYARYGNFDFITAGGELGVRLVDGFTVLAGVESYSVQRELPIEAQTPGENIYTWNTIFPINVGAVYQIDTGTVARPYAGADAIFVQYYADAQGAEWAAGARARLGVDLMVVPNFGFNANVAVGMWSGKKWTLIDPGLNNSSFLPQFNGGVVVAF